MWAEAIASRDPDEAVTPDEPEQLRPASRRVQGQLSAAGESLRQTGVKKEAGIMDAQRLILDDPAFVDAAMNTMADGVAAEKAV